MKQSIHLAVDIGAESGRVMAAGWDGQSVSLEEVHRFSNAHLEIGETLRWNVPGLAREVETGMARAAALHPDAVRSVGVDTWGVDYVLHSRTGEMLGLPFCYRDGRTSGRLKQLLERIPAQELYGATGIQFMEINTLCQWMAHAEQHPEVFAAAGAFFMMPDWLHWQLSGVVSCEFTNATTTQFFGPRERDWARDILRRLKLPHDFLKAVVSPGTCLGGLRRSIATRTGLKDVKVVVPATHDTASAVASVPVVGESAARGDWAYISSGTWSLVGIENPVPLLEPAAFRANLTNEGGVENTWRVLRNVMGLWLVQRVRRALAARGEELDYEALTRLAAAAPPARQFIFPDDPRFLNPPDMVEAIAEFCRETGQPSPQTPGEFVRCVLESLAFRYAEVLEWIQGASGRRIQNLHIVGGGSKNRLLNQLTADATGMVVHAGPVEATALGNALLQLRGMGEVGSLSDLRRISLNGQSLVRFEPGRDESGAVAGRFARYRTIVSKCDKYDRV